MGRPKGSKNKPNDVPASNGSVTADHNVVRASELTDDQRQALFFQHKKQYEKALEAKKRADADLKNACKLIKEEGSSLDEIKLALMDPAAFEKYARDRAESLIRVAQWLGSPVGTQFALFNEPDRTSSDEKAFNDGKRAGFAGEDASPPYAKHLPQAGKWLEGWHAGQAVVLAGFKPKVDDENFDDLGPVQTPAGAEVPPAASAALDEMAGEYAAAREGQAVN